MQSVARKEPKMEYLDIKSRFHMRDAVSRMNSRTNNYVRPAYPLPLERTKGQTQINIFEGTDYERNQENLITLARTRDAEPYQVADYFLDIEYLVQMILQGNVVPLFESLIHLYQVTTNIHVIPTVGQQFRTAAVDLCRRCSVGDADWVDGVNLFINYLDRVSHIDEMPNLTSAWKLIHHGNTCKHLAASLACALDLGTLSINDSSLGYSQRRVKYIFTVDTTWGKQWTADVQYQDKGCPRSRWAETFFVKLDGPTWELLHNWKPLKQIVVDDEADQVMEALSGIASPNTT